MLGALAGAAGGLIIAAMMEVHRIVSSASIGLLMFSGVLGALVGGGASAMRKAVRA
jgi:hypothetical protein